MTHKDHVDLIKAGITQKGGVWADLGSGTGAFTLALRDLAGEKVKIYSVDKDDVALDQQRELFTEMFGEPDITYLYQDFTHNLSLPPLDGILMANSLHYVQNQAPFLHSLQRYLKPNAPFILVEYNANEGNQWVPYPIAFETFKALAVKVGMNEPNVLGTIPSQFLNEIYAASATFK